MKKNLLMLLWGACLLTACSGQPIGENASVTTYVYAEKDGSELKLDVYMDSTALISNTKYPVFIFSFGGGWENGKREDGAALLNDFAHHGYIGVGIDYRLGIRQLKEEGVNVLDSTQFASSYSKAITMGVEDIFDATRYIIDHAAEWNADTSRIVVCGSSAGATNSLTAEYLICNQHSMATSRLPKGFNYAAVIPIAGGVWLKDTDTLIWQQKPCPVLAYHGTDDQLVPYDHLVLPEGAFGGFGPLYYMPQLQQMQVPHLFHTYLKGDHIVSAMHNSPTARTEMLTTLERILDHHAPLSLTITEEHYGEAPTFGNLFGAMGQLGIK